MANVTNTIGSNHEQARAPAFTLRGTCISAFAQALEMPIRALCAPLDSMQVDCRWPPTLTARHIEVALGLLYRHLDHFDRDPQSKDSLRGYAAGMVDGEGCITVGVHHGLERKSPTHRLRLQIGQSHRPTLELLQLTLTARSGLYAISRTSKQNKQAYSLNYDGVHVIHALSVVYPCLFTKKEQAEIAVRLWFEGRLWENPGPGGVHPAVRKHRERLVRKLSRMK